MRESDVIEWLIDESVAFLDTTSLVSVSTPSNHADEAQFHDGHVYPFVAVQQIGSTSESAGIGKGELFVDSLSYDTNDVLQSITYRRDVSLRVNVVPVTDEDPKLRDDLATDLTDHLSLVAEKNDHPDDIDDISVGEATPQDRPDDLVAADGIPLDVEDSRYVTDDDPDVAETVNVDVEVGDTSPASTFDETF